MKRLDLIRFIALAIAMLVAIASCQGQLTSLKNNPIAMASAESVDCRSIAHKMGKTSVCGQPQRIVVLGPTALESLLAFNVQPVGFADHFAYHIGDYTQPGQQIPYLGARILQPLTNLGDAYTPSIEAILKIQPDLILGSVGNTEDQYQLLSRVAPTLILDWFDSELNLRIVAQAINHSEQIEQLSRQTQQHIASARQSFASLVATSPKVLLLSSGELQQIYLGNSNHGRCSSLLKDLGFQLVAPPQSQQSELTDFAPISLETLPDLNHADQIILLGSNFSRLNQFITADTFENHQLTEVKQAWEKNAIAQSLNASKAGRVHFIPGYLCLGLPGPIGTELYLNELKKQLLSSN